MVAVSKRDEMKPYAYSYVNRFGREELMWPDKAETLIEAAKDDDRHYEAYPLICLQTVPQKWRCKECGGVLYADVDYKVPAACVHCGYDISKSEDFIEKVEIGQKASE